MSSQIDPTPTKSSEAGARMGATVGRNNNGANDWSLVGMVPHPIYPKQCSGSHITQTKSYKAGPGYRTDSIGIV